MLTAFSMMRMASSILPLERNGPSPDDVHGIILRGAEAFVCRQTSHFQGKDVRPAPPAPQARPPGSYSYRRAFTGSATAALSDWQTMGKAAANKEMRPAATNRSRPRTVR